MSLIVPWTDPNGTPCCCDSGPSSVCDYITILNGTFTTPARRSASLTQQQFANIYAGGSLTGAMSFSVSGSAETHAALFNYNASASATEVVPIQPQTCLSSNLWQISPTSSNCQATATSKIAGFGVASVQCSAVGTFWITRLGIYDNRSIANPYGIAVNVQGLLNITFSALLKNSDGGETTTSANAFFTVIGPKLLTIAGEIVNIPFTQNSIGVTESSATLSLAFTSAAP